MTENVRPNPAERSIRLFRNDLLESLTHVHPIVPLLFWTPVAAWLIWRAVAVHGIGPLPLAGIAAGAIVVWTLAEYLLHRFLFHYKATSRLGKYLIFMFHGVHHDAPRDKTRLVMPPAGAIIVLFLLWQLFALAIPSPWIEPFFGFFILSYLGYDYIHYATHHFPMRHPLLHAIKVYHLQHHYAAKGVRYGVTSPFWDRVFGTYPVRGATAAARSR